MGILEDIKQSKDFKNPYEKLIVNVLYTSSWLLDQQNRFFKEHGITSPQYNVLRILRGQYPEPCTVNTIIDRMLDKMSNASRIVDRLEVKELVARTVCESDRRAKDVVITEKGLKVLEEVDTALKSWLDQFQPVGKEVVEKASDTLDSIRAIVQ